MIERRRLLQSLQQSRPRRLTIITAPAGYGKTSLGAQWFHSLDAPMQHRLWVSLDAEHRDQTQFLLLLLEALSFLGGDDPAGRDASSMSASSLVAVLKTRLRKIEQTLVLFLDDYHFAQNDGTDTVLAKLLSDAELEHVRFVLISRSPPQFPLSALKARGELRQIGTAELGFSADEAREFFSSSPVRLAPDTIDEFNRLTEGWAVALQMLLLLVDDTNDGASILASFDAGNGDMGSYLSEQVFVNLPPAMQEFLVETACFPAINRDMVSAVFERDDMAVAVDTLGSHALPVTMLAGPGGWVRYHPVLHAFLKKEAERRSVDTLGPLRKSAIWLDQHGDRERAIRHALLCDDVNLAARIVESAGGWRLVYSTTRGRTAMFHAILERAAEIDLPRFPLTTLGFAVVSAKAAQLDLADHYLSVAENKIEHHSNDIIGSDLRVVRVLVALYLDRWVGSADLSALEHDVLQPGEMDVVTRALTLNMLAYNYLARSELNRSVHYGELAIHAFRSGGADFGAMHLYAHTGQAWFFSGDCTAAGEAYDRLIREAQTNVGIGSDLDAVGQVLKAELQSVSSDPGAAEQMLSWALPHLERHDTWFDLLAAGFTAQQRIHRARGDMSAAHTSADRARSTALRRGFDRLTRLIDGERATLLLSDGDVDAAIRYATGNGFGPQSVDADRPNNLAVHLRGTTPALLWTRIHLAQGDHQTARRMFDQLRIRQSQRPHAMRLIELSLIDIQLMLAEGNRDRAAVQLSDLMLTTTIADYPTLLHIEGNAFCADLRLIAATCPLPLVIKQRLGTVLGNAGAQQLAGSDHPPGQSDVDGRLTDRERQVMHLLSTGLSNKEIGRCLSLSDNTIKFHLHNIYSKLNVRTRTAAVVAARDLLAHPA